MYPLVIKNLTKYFRPNRGWFSSSKSNAEFPVINNISFSLKVGEIVALMGSNGAGKSTLMHMLIGILTPSSGSINYFGKDFSRYRSALSQDISFASSYFKLAGSLTIIQNLQFFAQMYSMPKQVSNKKIDDLMLSFNLSDHKHKKVSDLSAGQSNKLSILKAFLPNSKIVLLDEPTAFLDQQTVASVRTLIKEQRDKMGTTFFIASHSQEDISELGDRVITLEQGSIKEFRTRDYLENKSCPPTQKKTIKLDLLDNEDPVDKS